MHGPTIGDPERALIANCEELGLLTEWTEPTFDSVTDACSFCGAVVAVRAKATHVEWHKLLTAGIHSVGSIAKAFARDALEPVVDEGRGEAGSMEGCAWCFSATQALRAASGDPTATTTCVVHA